MPLWTLLLLALGVSADAFAVALGKGLAVRRNVLRNALVLAAAFGLFQALMPLLGWMLGAAFADVIAPFDHWIAFVLLAAVGGKMLWEALHKEEDDEASEDGFTVREVLILSVATSIDALAVGVSLSFFDISIWFAIAVIGVVTFLCSVVAVLIGHRVGTRYRRPAEIIGGLVLIGIGASILIEHLSA